MTTKEWLMRAWRIDREIEAMLNARDRAYARCVSVTTRSRDVVVSGSRPDPDAALIGLLSIEAMIDKRIDELHSIKVEVIEAISQVPDSTLRTLLIERYINCKTWEQIAVDMHYAYRYVVCLLHPKALEAIGPIVARYV